MATKREGQEAAAAGPVVCKTCGLNLGAAGDWNGPVVHCVGAEKVFRVIERHAHHGHHFWNCPRCRRVIGCDICAGTKPENILCEPCETFANGDVLIGSGRNQIHVDLRPIKQAAFKSGIEASQPREAQDF